MSGDIPGMGAVFWPVGTGDSSTIVVSEEIVMQVDLHDMSKADDDENPEVPVVDRLVAALPQVNGRPYLAVFALTHADKDHCLGFADLLDKVDVGELWATPRLWREYEETDGDGLCEDAQAFQVESERRVAAVMAAVGAGREPATGDRILVIGYDTDHDKHAYDELPEEYKSGPGKSITALDGYDCSNRFEAFIHAPFADDCAAARNETSLAMQVRLTDDSGQEGRLLLFGDLAHDTIVKIIDYSEYHKRERYLTWDVLLAPHHCSKKVMYLPNGDGRDVLQLDVINAFRRHGGNQSAVVSSSGVIPTTDSPGANPPHRKAANRYAEIADEFICTMAWPNTSTPFPVVFTVDAHGARIVQQETVKLAARETRTKSGPRLFGHRLAAVTAAASLADDSAGVQEVAGATGPERVRHAIVADRGGDKAPGTAVGFGQ